MTKYPEGKEVAWIACDSNDNAGIFITAGYGPIPECILSSVQILSGEIEDAVLECLAEKTESHLLSLGGDVSTFESLARRGLFTYDWTDIGRTKKMKVYEKIAQPAQSLKARDLPPKLRELARSVLFSDVNFHLAHSLAVHRYISCVWP